MNEPERQSDEFVSNQQESRECSSDGAHSPETTPEQLRESEERFRLFVENVTDYALVQVDPDRNISGWNTGAERGFGYTEEEIIGRPMSVLFRPEDISKGDVENDFQEALSAGRSEYERWLVRKDDTTFWARWVTTPMYDDVGRLRGYAKGNYIVDKIADLALGFAQWNI